MNSTILLQAAQGGGPVSPAVMQFIFIGLIIVVFYFFMMRPQMKKQKEQAKFLEEIKKGDRVVTIGGIIGKVLEVRTKSYVIETEGGTRIQILKSAISHEFSRTFKDETEEKKD
jgi:preprotein translocase subunit YajC